MIPKNIIKKAIEGGYGNLKAHYINNVGGMDIINYHSVLLDPLFWQSLGKALDIKFEESFYYDFVSFDKWDWQQNALQFFNLILTGGDVDKFWADLSKE